MINADDPWNFPKCSKIDVLQERRHGDIIHILLRDKQTQVEPVDGQDWVLYNDHEALLVRTAGYPLKLLMMLYTLFTKLALILVLLAAVGVVHADDPIGKVEIPALKIKERIYFAPLENETWNPEYWDDNVAFLEGTAWIDQGEFNTVLVSHDTGPLKDITELNIGDKITVTSETHTATYMVTSKWVTPDTDVEPVMPTQEPALTLIICWDTHNRYIVHADRIEYE